MRLLGRRCRRRGRSCSAPGLRPRATRGTGAEGAARSQHLGPERRRCCFFSFPPIWQRRAATGPRWGLDRSAEATAAGRCTCLTGVRRSRSSATGWCRSRSARTTRGSVPLYARYAKEGCAGRVWVGRVKRNPSFSLRAINLSPGPGPAAWLLSLGCPQSLWPGGRVPWAGSTPGLGVQGRLLRGPPPAPGAFVGGLSA